MLIKSNGCAALLPTASVSLRTRPRSGRCGLKHADLSSRISVKSYLIGIHTNPRPQLFCRSIKTRKVNHLFKLKGFFKPFIPIAILAILLLGLQAYGELSLPDYMSKVVSVGLSQGGIENAVPEAIRVTEAEHLFTLMNDETVKLFSDNYILLSRDNFSEGDYGKYLKKYPLAETEPTLILNTKDKAVKDELGSALPKSMIMVYALNNKDSADSFTSGANFDFSMFPEGVDPFVVLANLPAEARAAMIQKADELLVNLPKATATQLGTTFVKQEYAALGADIKSMQNNYIYKSGLNMLGFSGLILFAIIFETLLASRIGAGLGRNIRDAVFKKVVSFSSKEFDSFSTASLITRTTNDVQLIQQMIPMLFRVVIYAPILATGGVFKVLSTDYSMSWIIAAGVGIIIAIVIVMFVVAVPKFKLTQKLIDKMNLVLRETLTGMPVIRAFSNQETEEKRFEDVNTDLTKIGLFIGKVFSFMMPIMMITLNGISLVIIWLGAHNIDAGIMQVGDMMAFLQYSMQIMMSFLMMTMISMMLPRATVAANRIHDVLKSKVSILDPESAKLPEKSKKGVVEFKDVFFKYPGAEENVLHNISFKATPGTTTALIGSTGCGKSTLINLIPRFYDSTEGSITVGGVNVRDMKQHDLRSLIGLVPQKALLFSGSIESNIKYADENMTDELMEKAARISQAEEFINEKSEKFQEPISQGGVNVSGGQRQRLSIARALAKDPEILIFDDSFSALDYKTDRKLREALDKEMKDKTVIIVAQRIGTIKDADNIIVLDEEKIVGTGKHRDLLESCEVYNQIALSQLSKEELMNA